MLLIPNLTLELRDRGLIYYQLGYYPQAIDDLQNYLAEVPDAVQIIVGAQHVVPLPAYFIYLK